MPPLTTLGAMESAAAPAVASALLEGAELAAELAGSSGAGGRAERDSVVGIALAVSSSAFIGSSFIVKKKGLRVAAAQANAPRAGAGGFGYLKEPLWWLGMTTMVVGEIANFAAYAFAPALVVTPLGALSIIVSAILADRVLGEKLHTFGWLGCLLCIIGSLTIVLHSPEERSVDNVLELWYLAMEPAFLMYASTAVVVALYLMYIVGPVHGNSNILVYLFVCSLFGSLSVMSCKALGVALKLTFQGHNQLVYRETWYCALVVAFCVVTQMNYLNKALDIFNTAVVTPIYYVLFTTLTILASVIMFKEWESQTPPQLVTEACGFVTILSGVFLLHVTRDSETFRKRFLAEVPVEQTSPAKYAPGYAMRRSGSIDAERGGR